MIHIILCTIIPFLIWGVINKLGVPISLVEAVLISMCGYFGMLFNRIEEE